MQASELIIPKNDNNIVPGEIKKITAPTGLIEKAVKFLERCHYRVIRSDEDRKFIENWRYEHYINSKTVRDPNMTRNDLIDGKDDVPTAKTVCLYVDDNPVSSMRIHCVSLDYYDNMKVIDCYPEIIRERVLKGKRIIYVGRWISEPKFSTNPLAILATLRIPFIAAYFYKADYVVSTSRENHIKTFEKIHSAEVWSPEAVELDKFNYKYHLLGTDFLENIPRSYHDRQMFLTSWKEINAMMADQPIGQSIVKPSTLDILAGLDKYADDDS